MKRCARISYLASGFALVAGIYLQVYLATAAVSVQYGNWSAHVMVGRALVAPVAVMLLCTFLGKLPRKINVLTLVTVGLYLLQHALMAIPMPDGLLWVKALHGVGALALYTVAHMVVVEAFRGRNA